MKNMHLNAAWLAVAVCLTVFAGCTGSDDADGSGDTPQAADENVRQLPKIAGTPTDAGYFNGGVSLLASADPNSGAAMQLTARTFPMAVRIEVEKAATLVPAEYTVYIEKKTYRPVGISFGEKRETFFSLEHFVADEVELKLNGSDQINTNKAGKLNSCSLSTGEVYLLYHVPGGGNVVKFQYDGSDYDLRPSYATDLGVEPLAIKTPDTTPKPSGPQGLQVEIVRGQLAIGTIDDKEIEVFELELLLKSSKYESVDLHLGKDFFLEGNAATDAGGKKKRGRKSRKLFVEMQEDRMRLLAGSEYFDNTYKEKPMKELVNGGVVISVEPGLPLTVFFVFPNPPFENGLSLRFPGKPPLDVVPAGDVLGEIRPAIPRGVAKIPRAPIVGEPVKVNLIQGNILVDSGGKSLAAMGPGGGNQFVMLKFSIKGERKFIPRDYVLRDAADKNYYPVAAVLGRASAQKLSGDGYDAIELRPGETDIVRKRKGQLLYWQYAEPEFAVIFALPQTLSTFDFSHGNRLLKITPVTRPTSWKEIRPDDKLAASGKNSPKTPATTKKPPASAADMAERNAKRAASQLRLGKVILKKDAGKARKYFAEAVRLAPDSPAGKEAKQLLDGLK